MNDQKIITVELGDLCLTYEHDYTEKITVSRKKWRFYHTEIFTIEKGVYTICDEVLTAEEAAPLRTAAEPLFKLLEEENQRLIRVAAAERRKMIEDSLSQLKF